MNTCDSCKYFDPFNDNGGPSFPIPFGGCGRWKVGYHNHELALNECQVEGDEGWGMIIGPKFGCVLHEPKTEAENRS